MLKLKFTDNRQEPLWLVDPGISVGSDTDNDLVLVDSGIGKKHALLNVSGEDVTLKSAKASTFVNGDPVSSEQLLKVGDLIRFHQVECELIDPKQELNPTTEAEEAMSTEASAGKKDPGAAVQRSGWVLQVTSGPLTGKLFPIDKVTTLGRGAACDITIPESRLSREHAKLAVVSGALVVKDLESSNGTFLNGQQITQARPDHNDELSFDTFTFKVIGPANDEDKTVMSFKAASETEPATKAKPATKEPATGIQAAVKAPVAESAATEKSNMGIIIGVVVILIIGAAAFFAL